MAYFDFANPALAPEALWSSLSVIGAFILLISGALFLAILLRGQTDRRIVPEAYRFSTALNAPLSVPAALNGYALWVALMIGLTVTNYGFPIGQLLARGDTSVPAVCVGTRQ